MEQFITLSHIAIVHRFCDPIPVSQDVQDDLVSEEDADLFVED